MAGTTQNYGLRKLEAGDKFSNSSYQFGTKDRDFLDAVLKILEEHDHSGTATSDPTPTDPPTLTLDTTTGALPAGTRVFYKYTLVDENGLETATSPEAFVDTPDPIQPPNAPSLTTETTGGTHPAGDYAYVLSAYVTENTSETLARNVIGITIPRGTTTNQVTLTLPTLPSGADGFNVYRIKPGGQDYVYLDSIDMTGATPSETYVDDNSVSEDPARFLPTANTTSRNNSVTVEVGSGLTTPNVPDGFTWKVYRTFVNGDYENSFLTHVTEAASFDSSDTTPEYEDLGTDTTSGQPPNASQIFAAPGAVANTHIGAWTTYTPNWTATGANPDIVDGTLNASYKLESKSLTLRIFLEIGPNTTLGSGVWSFSLPPGVTSTSAGNQLIPAKANDTGSTNNYTGAGSVLPSATTVTNIHIADGGGTNAGKASDSGPIAGGWADGDILFLNGEIEVA